MSYSLDLRKHVFKIKQQERLTFQETSDRFGVPTRTLFRWKKHIEPITKRNKPSTKIDMAALQKAVEQHPDRYQYEHARKFGVAQSTIFYALKRLNITHKKTLFHPKADEWLRYIFQLKLFRYEVIEKRPVIYLDESGFAVDVPRENGYSRKGEKCFAGKGWHARGRANAIGAIHNFKLLNVCLFDCNIDADVFYAWLTQELLPNVPQNAVIVLDNAAFHKRQDALSAVKQQGHIFEFLPPYSPDLNPIEKK